MTHAQDHFLQLHYGMFLHFGINTFFGEGWGDGTKPASAFAPEQLDCRQWARMAKDSGMTYAVLTTKHHDGFCLWPSRHTGYSVKNAGIRRDVVREFAEAFRAEGLEVGFYYSLWDRNYPAYSDDEAYFAYMKNQLTELLTEYGPVLELWFDGGWDKDSPARVWEWEPGPGDPVPDGSRWHWKELYAHIHALQPDCLVIQNSSSNRPGRARYMPVDAVTSEHFNFIFQDRLCVPPADRTLPLEFCTSLNPAWFHTGAWFSHPSAECIAGWRRTADEQHGNLLLNVGPDRRGLIPEYHRPFLLKARELYENITLEQ